MPVEHLSDRPFSGDILKLWHAICSSLIEMAFIVSEVNGAGATAAGELSTLSAPLHRESAALRRWILKQRQQGQYCLFSFVNNRLTRDYNASTKPSYSIAVFARVLKRVPVSRLGVMVRAP
jgi:hypothetical protein